MISTLISLLILLLILGIVWWVIGQIALPAPIKQAVIVVFAIIVIVVLLGYLPGVPWHGRY